MSDTVIKTKSLSVILVLKDKLNWWSWLKRITFCFYKRKQATYRKLVQFLEREEQEL